MSEIEVKIQELKRVYKKGSISESDIKNLKSQVKCTKD